MNTNLIVKPAMPNFGIKVSGRQTVKKKPDHMVGKGKYDNWMMRDVEFYVHDKSKAKKVRAFIGGYLRSKIEEHGFELSPFVNRWLESDAIDGNGRDFPLKVIEHVHMATGEVEYELNHVDAGVYVSVRDTLTHSAWRRQEIWKRMWASPAFYKRFELNAIIE